MTIRGFANVLLCSTFCWLSSHAQAAGAPILCLDYERDTPTSEIAGVVAVMPNAVDAISIDCTLARSGRCSLRSKVANSPDYISFGAHRAESNTEALEATRYSSGDTIRYEFSLYLPTDWEVDSRDSVDIVWQFKRFDSYPDMFVGIKGQDVVLRLTGGKQETLVKNYSAGEWIDFRLDILWSHQSTGKVIATIRLPPDNEFKEVVKVSGANMGDSRSRSTYLKWGIYKPGYKYSTTVRPRIVFHDKICVERWDTSKLDRLP